MKTIKCYFILLLISAFLFLYPENLKGNGKESPVPRNLIFLELGGHGILYSINYDYKINDNFSLRAGFSSWTLSSLIFLIDGKISFTGVPFMGNYLYGKHDNKLEIGMGIMPAIISIKGNYLFFGQEIGERKKSILGVGTIAYRYQPKEGGITIRAGLTPFFVKNKFVFTGGVSLGYSF